MDEEKEHSQYQKDRADHSEEDDSFYVGEEGNDREDDKRQSEPQQYKHRQSKPKKKGIIKKKERMSKTTKKPQMTKEKEKQMKMSQIGEKKVEEILQKMKECYELDISLFEQKKMACRKLGYLQELAKSLRNLYISEKFLEKDGMSWFQKWLDKITVGDNVVEPSVSLRKGVLQILLNMSIGPDNVSKISEIQRLVARQKRSQIKELRDLSEKIIMKWNQLSYEQN